MVEEEMSSAYRLGEKIAIEKNRYHEGIRNKYCYICNRCNSLGITPKDHECFKNWTESSQSMESDIIVEGFLKANDFGVRYMHFIADGDSSIHAQIMQRVPVWGKLVQKMECANHITKCLRGNLENLVNENPSYKGKGKLCKRTRIRIVSAVRCSIRRRSSEINKTLAIKNLEHDIRNTTSHIYGDHTRCNEDFCKVKQTSDKNHSNEAQTDEIDDDDNGDDDIFLQQSEMWTQGTSSQAQEQSRQVNMLCNSDLQSGMRRDLALLLNNVARKARSLIGNFTTNLEECWMHMRTKFDGGKLLNHCNRGSWHTRCYATALRFNKGPTWSPNVWEQATKSTPGVYFEKLYEQRKQCINNNNTTKDKCKSNTKKAKQHYGKESLQVETDITLEELEKLKVNYLNKNIDIPEADIIKIEEKTTLQLCSEIWKDERKKRITASNFGSVVKRNSKIKIAPLIKQLLYSTFKGNKTTRIGIKEEKVTITEYVNIKQKENIHTKVKQSGLVIDKHHKFLGGSPDGIVTENNAKGLIEIKNLVHDKNINLTQASMSVKNFCLEKISNNLKLKTNHNYYFQCQGLLNVCNLPWIDFVVRTLNPYDIHIERIYKDTILWQTKMIPKLTAFYHNALLPELVSPRYNKYPGIREPGIWYTEVPYLGSTSSQQTSGKVKTRRRKPLTVESDTEIDEAVNKDGDKDAVYEVLYEDCDEPYEIEHLLEDFTSSSLKLIDL
ncbi:unnamed protein product [Mytilus coruscus]|uniref:Uncharacterized protein n=1 Tax=Mytilus coruscus TaxID=42192 RepID=A0A6J8B8B6_MYTCO|nr:unnamed protein product [Mytilus coruscus]